MKNSYSIDSARLVLVGAICGDIIGSRKEFHNNKRTDFRLITPECRFTDDTVCSIAIADAINSGSGFDKSLVEWCRRYPHSGYGRAFKAWFKAEEQKPYRSWGNGSAMRVSAVGAIARSLDEMMTMARDSAAVTHNHPKGIAGAQATAVAIYFALRGMDKQGIKSVIEKGFGYDLSRDYWLIRNSYSFDVSCAGSVPEAIIAFLESTDYESAVRLAVALGGDADTQAAIAGGIAAAYYGEIPDKILKPCLALLPNCMKETISEFNNTINKRHGREKILL